MPEQQSRPLASILILANVHGCSACCLRSVKYVHHHSHRTIRSGIDLIVSTTVLIASALSIWGAVRCRGCELVDRPPHEPRQIQACLLATVAEVDNHSFEDGGQIRL